MDPLVNKHLQTIFSYLFGRISKYEYRDLIGDKTIAKELWQKVSNDGYLLKNCKLFLYANLVAKSTGVAISPARFEIERSDVNALRKLDLSGVSLRSKSYSLFDFDALEGAIVTSTEMDVYIGKFISKKLIFLCKSYGLSREEIKGDLRCAAIYALRKHYPFYHSELHAANICKTAIKNAGQGLIEFWTRDKRNALLKENGQFQAVHVQYEVLNDLSVGPEHDDELRLNLQALASVASRLPAVQQEWLRAAAGQHDVGFSFFLGRDNRDVVETMPYDRYLDSLCGYHRIRREVIIDSLRRSLS